MHPAGLPPANSPFEAEDDHNFTTDAQMVGRLGFAPSSRRLRAGTSLSKFATQANAKAELNHRGQICEVLIDTGISYRGKRNPKRTESGFRPLLRPCGVSADAPDSLGKWTGMRVARPLLRFGRPPCVSQHLCPEKWNPVLESHQPLRLCRPLPELIGQRDLKSKSERKLSPPLAV